MKITIDLEEFWSDQESGNLTEQIKEHISWNVKNEVWKNVEKQCKDYYDLEVKKVIESSIKAQIEEITAKCMSEDLLKKKYSNNESITTADWIKEEIGHASIDRGTIKEFVDVKAKEMGKELKDRYDLLFASQLVSKLHENGMLKEDVAKLLLPKE